MRMAKFTFLEIHLDDSTVTASAPFKPGEKEVTASEEPPEDDTGGSTKASAIAALVGLTFLAVVAYVAKRKFLDGEEFDEEIEIET